MRKYAWLFPVIFPGLVYLFAYFESLKFGYRLGSGPGGLGIVFLLYASFCIGVFSSVVYYVILKLWQRR